MDRRDGYKKTELGWIPEDWDEKRIGELVSFSGGSQPPRKSFVFEPKGGYIRLIQIRDYKTDKYKTFVPINSTKKYCTKEDIMIGRYGPPIFQILRGIEGAYNVALIKCIPKNGINKDYLWYFLNQRKLFYFIENLSQRSSGQTGVDMEMLKLYPLPLPPLPEQQKIAEILTTVDDKISSIEDQIQQTEQLKKGLMEKLLTEGIGHTEFKDTEIGRIPKSWDVGILLDLSEIIMGQSPPGTSYNNNGQGVPMLNGPTEFSKISPIPVQYTTSPTKMCQEQDILFCVRGSSTGRMNIADQEYCIGRGLAAIRQKEHSNTKFIHYILTKITNKILFEAKGAGSTFPNVSGRDLSEKSVAIPSHEEQKQIASILNAVDDKIEILNSKKTEYQTLKKGLMAELLTGKRRVKI